MIRDSMAREHGGNVAVPSTRFTKRNTAERILSYTRSGCILKQ